MAPRPMVPRASDTGAAVGRAYGSAATEDGAAVRTGPYEEAECDAGADAGMFGMGADSMTAEIWNRCIAYFDK
jgi:hypothetical protein